MTSERSQAGGIRVPPPLRAAVAEAYRAFAIHGKPSARLDVCTECCVSPEIELQLREWSLGQLPAGHFYEYNCSAKSEVQTPEEVGYLLPRMLELLANGIEIHHSLELSLDRLGRCPVGSWTQDENTALNRFALAYFEPALWRGMQDENGNRRWFDDPLSVLLMFDIGGIAIEPLLDLWLLYEHPHSTVEFVRSTYWQFWANGEYSNPFASDRPAFRHRIRAWLTDPAHRSRFAAKMTAPDFLELAAAQVPIGHTSFGAMTDVVLTQLTQ